MPEFVTQQVPGTSRRALGVDVFRPERPSGVGIILLHGGGWARGDRSMVHGYAKALASAGFVALAAEYRFLPLSEIHPVQGIIRGYGSVDRSSLTRSPIGRSPRNIGRTKCRRELGI